MTISIISYARHVNYSTFDPFNRNIWANMALTFGISKHLYIMEGFPPQLPNREVEPVRNLEVALSLVDASLVNVRPPDKFKSEGQHFVYLDEFLHPGNACYVFGPNYGDAPIVDTPYNLALKTEHPLYAFTAGSIVLYDRKLKKGGLRKGV